MRKFSKRSIAVLTTAAIMASSMSIVAYAAASTVTWTSDKITNVQKFDAEEETWVDFTSGSKATKVRFKVVEGTEVVGLTANANGYYSVDVSADTNLDTYIKKAGGSTSEPTPAGEENTDKVVWVNGKDTKGSKDGTIPASLYKTESFDLEMMSAGGKWQVAVTPATVATVEDFMGELDEKGKIKNAKDYKELATAKIKEGTITVTAGKKAAEVNVWVYEVKAKKVVNTETVKPVPTSFTAKVAPTMVTTADKTTVEDGAIKAIASPKKLEKGYDADSEVLVYFGDKKAAVSVDATYVLWDGKNKKALELTDGKFVKEGEYTAELVAAADGVGPAVKITIDAKATEKTKIDVQVKNVESGKIAKISPKVNKAAAKEDPKEDNKGGEEGGSEGDTPAAE